MMMKFMNGFKGRESEHSPFSIIQSFFHSQPTINPPLASSPSSSSSSSEEEEEEDCNNSSKRFSGKHEDNDDYSIWSYVSSFFTYMKQTSLVVSKWLTFNTTNQSHPKLQSQQTQTSFSS